MAKVTKSMLKSIVKECLVEILSEGIGNPEPLLERKKRSSSNAKPDLMMEQALARKRKKLDQMRVNQIENNPLIKNADPLMAEIFRDTAQNTLGTMIEADENPGMAQRLKHGDAAARHMAASDPADLFEGADKWASLAFTPAKN
tara:strand:+ start:480 stop:911 length:432 start_codon:yes stop_codon:yes gene_type:complete